MKDRQCYIRSLNSITETPYFSADIENTHTSSKTCGKQAQYPEAVSKQCLQKKKCGHSEMIVRCSHNLNNSFSGKHPYRKVSFQDGALLRLNQPMTTHNLCVTGKRIGSFGVKYWYKLVGTISART